MWTDTIPIEAWKVLANAILDGSVHTNLNTSMSGKCRVYIQCTFNSNEGKMSGMYVAECTSNTVLLTARHTYLLGESYVE